VEFDFVGAYVVRRFDLFGYRIDEQAHFDLVSLKVLHHVTQLVLVPADIQPSFRRQLLTPLRDECCKIGKRLDGDLHNLFGCRHFKVELAFEAFAKQPEVPVIDMSPVFAEMTDDAVCACELAEVSRSNGVRFDTTACFTQRGDVVDID
jgi:hypothetical protein